MRNYDPRIGSSVTMTGRCISRHMAGVVNDIICGVKDHRGESIIYGDSVHERTIINTNMGLFTIGQLYDYCSNKWEERGKYFSSDDTIKVLSYNPETKQPEYYPINHVIKHWTEKEMFEIRDTRRIEPNVANTNFVIVTADHSLMIERNGDLVKIKPTDILPTDVLIGLADDNKDGQRIVYKSTCEIKSLGIVPQNVYDISIKSDDKSRHTFFGNNILLKNTDSVKWNSKIDTKTGETSIENLFQTCEKKWVDGEKEYAWSDVKIKAFDGKTKKAKYMPVNYIYRHKVSKDQWVIKAETGQEVITTGDHSIMVERNKEIIEVKPIEIKPDDLLIING
jgi:hypothetical protein